MNSNSLADQALALHRSGQLVQAEALYVRAAEAAPQDASLRNSLGVVRAQQGRGADALEALDAALALRPGDDEIILNRANVLQMLGRPAEALPGFDHVLAAKPDWPQVLNNRGSALADLGRTAEALESYGRAIALAPTFTPARNNRGGVLLDQKRFAEALADFDSALRLKPDDPVLLNNRGNALQGLLRYEDAVTAYTGAIARNPGAAETFSNRAGALQQMKRHADALADFETALALDPAQPHAFGGAAMAAMNLCDWSRVAKFASQMPTRIAEVPPWVLLGYGGDEALQLACARAAINKRFAKLPSPLAGDGYAHDRIRLAYISSDFRHHPVAAQVARVIALHDRARFAVIGISTGPDDASPQRRRLVAAFDQFHDMRGGSAAAIAHSLRAMEVDILVDLNGHTDGDNFNILAHRPAPVQAGWLGYAGTTAASFIDYLIADAVVAPDDTAFSERLVRLPRCFFPTDDTLVIGTAPTREQEGLPGDGFVFCCFNNNWKFTAPVFALWMRLLDAVPHSVLWLKDAGEALPNLRRAAQKAGIDPARLVFARGAPLDVHLARHALADLFLDTLPYNAHATACDALAAGLPVLTCRGTDFAGRVAASMLTTSGLPELITETSADYEALALVLARNPARLKALRGKLAANRALFDTARFTRDLEDALISLT
jgi:protein O-GlcNAc transferase